MILVDPPSPFAPEADWLAFLKEMEDLAVEHPDNEEVRQYIEEAKEVIAR